MGGRRGQPAEGGGRGKTYSGTKISVCLSSCLSVCRWVNATPTGGGVGSG